MAKFTYCRFCNKEHNAVETVDKGGTVLGLYCAAEKRMITVFNYVWDGVDILEACQRLVSRMITVETLPRTSGDSLYRLSRKYAFTITNTAEFKRLGISYYYVQHIVLDVLRALKERQYRKGRA